MYDDDDKIKMMLMNDLFIIHYSKWALIMDLYDVAYTLLDDCPMLSITWFSTNSKVICMSIETSGRHNF